MPEELPELISILQSGALSYGKWGQLFENGLQHFIDTDNLLTTNTYSSALQIALTVLELQSGDEVIASPMSCLASNQPLATFGLKIVWADIDPKTGTLSPDSVKEKITSKTKLIFHNHFCGYIGYVDEINSIGRQYGISVLDDCIEAFGSKYKGNYAGHLGTDITVFSFQTVRLPNTIDGGAIVFKDKKLFEKALLTRDFGIQRSVFRDAYGEISVDCDISMLGYGATMSEINSYIGYKQMNDIKGLLALQRENALCWSEYLDTSSCSAIDLRGVSEANFWVYGLLSSRKKNDMLAFRSNGFYASGVHLPNNFYSVFGDKVPLPGVSDFYSSFIAIPSGWWMNANMNYGIIENIFA